MKKVKITFIGTGACEDDYELSCFATQEDKICLFIEGHHAPGEYIDLDVETAKEFSKHLEIEIKKIHPF